jgi:hypothetical protein
MSHVVNSSTPSDGDGRVVRFRPRQDGPAPARPTPPGAEDDLAAFSRTPEDPGEYRHRMAVNAAALLFVVVLIGIALWLAQAIGDMRRNQDCVLSGRRGCTPVEYDPIPR